MTASTSRGKSTGRAVWWIATHKEDLSQSELEERVRAFEAERMRVNSDGASFVG